MIRRDLLSMCELMLSGVTQKIRYVAKFIGKLVSSFPGVQFGELYYKYLERDKIYFLNLNKGNYDAEMILSDESKEEISWWSNTIENSFKTIKTPPTDEVITTDASNLGWGAVYKDQTSGGQWDLEEEKMHINVLELKAVFFALKSFLANAHNKHIQIKTDNTTTVAYINNFGGVKSIECHKVARDIWEWAFARNNLLCAVHLPGSQNELADKASRIFDTNTEWELDTDVFVEVCKTFGNFQIDLFASRLNAKLEKYVAWKPDPNAVCIDAFSIPWTNIGMFYAYPLTA